MAAAAQQRINQLRAALAVQPDVHPLLAAAAACAAGGSEDSKAVETDADAGSDSDGPQQQLLAIEVPCYWQLPQHRGLITGPAAAHELALFQCLVNRETCQLGSGSEGTVFALAPEPGSCGTPGCTHSTLCTRCTAAPSTVAKVYHAGVAVHTAYLGSNVFSSCWIAARTWSLWGCRAPLDVFACQSTLAGSRSATSSRVWWRSSAGTCAALTSCRSCWRLTDLNFQLPVCKTLSWPASAVPGRCSSSHPAAAVLLGDHGALRHRPSGHQGA
ncbi:hypothetical protein COO60DRAFT_558476 [Scenedesmus sp. NREL 46B-D3]|nr:hypothetical protein COO60DRAFT_558476 [Scenedesmus sp. NREL 46B-D3]